jgi:hypothetical protein
MRVPPPNPQLEALLEPRLTHDAPASLYSARAGFLVSFFGGPASALAFGGLNAWRLRRLKTDSWILVLGVTAYLGAAVFLVDSGRTVDVSGVLLDKSDVRRVFQALGVALFGIFYFCHRRYLRAMTLADVPPRPGLRDGILMILGGWVIQIGVVALCLSMK